MDHEEELQQRRVTSQVIAQSKHLEDFAHEREQLPVLAIVLSSRAAHKPFMDLVIERQAYHKPRAR